MRRTALTPRKRSLALVALLACLCLGCTTLQPHFRVVRTVADPIPDGCRRIERCDYPRYGAQARCEMADLQVPEQGDLLECMEEEWIDG